MTRGPVVRNWACNSRIQIPSLINTADRMQVEGMTTKGQIVNSAIADERRRATER